MKTLLICTLLFCSLARGQYLSYSKDKLPKDYSLVTATHWRQLSGPIGTTIVTPDSLTTKILNINKAGTYRYELAITFLRNGVTSVVRDTVRLTSNPPVKDSVFVIQKLGTQKTIEVVSRVQSSALIQVLSGGKIMQKYTYAAWSGIRILYVTGICDACTVRITLNKRIWEL